MKTRAALFLALLTATAHAGPRGSTSYSIPTDSTDAGGQRTTSAAYTNDGSLGGITGISTVAAPLLDPDGDGQNNAFEFTAGLIPTDAQSRFTLTIAPVPGQPAEKKVIFDPIVAGRSYTVMASSDLTTGSWITLPGGSVTNNGDQRTVTDPAASATKKFYKVEIVKP